MSLLMIKHKRLFFSPGSSTSYVINHKKPKRKKSLHTKQSGHRQIDLISSISITLRIVPCRASEPNPNDLDSMVVNSMSCSTSIAQKWIIIWTWSCLIEFVWMTTWVKYKYSKQLKTKLPEKMKNVIWLMSHYENWLIQDLIGMKYYMKSYLDFSLLCVILQDLSMTHTLYYLHISISCSFHFSNWNHAQNHTSRH